MADQFPLTRSLGVAVHEAEMYNHAIKEVVLASEIEALLAAAPVVTVENHKTFGWSGQQHDPVGDTEGYTHTARLLCVEPIVRESEERRLLRELVLKCAGDCVDISDTLERARKLLGEV